VQAAASTKELADKKVSELGTRYGSLAVQKVGESYDVCPAGGPVPCSEAVSKAVRMYQIETPPPGEARRQPDYARLSRHIRVSSGLSCALEQPSQELRRKAQAYRRTRCR